MRKLALPLALLLAALPVAAQSTINGRPMFNMTRTQTYKVIDAATLNATATIYSAIPWEAGGAATNSWLVTNSLQSLSVWTYGTSAGGTVNYNVYADLSPQPIGTAYNTSDTTLYVPILLTSTAIASDGVLTLLTSARTSYDDLNYPFQTLRIRVVGTATNPADSVIHVWVSVAE